MHAVIDAGTTNTRIYIVNDCGEIVGRACRKVGVRDVAISGSKQVLIDGLLDCFVEAINFCDVSLQDIEFAFVSGMLTSEIGLIDLPHITAPAGKEDLVSNCVVLKDPEIFPLPTPLVFIRGVKNNVPATIQHMGDMDFMRGEETQVMGVLHRLKPTLPCYVVFLSSHTKIIKVDEKGRIASSMTTLSGQIFEAINNETMIGKSVITADYNKSNHETEILNIVRDSVNTNGLLRTLMLPRFMEVLMQSDSQDRAYCLNAAIACDDMKTLYKMLKNEPTADVILIGQQRRCNLYQTLIKLCGLKVRVHSIYDAKEIDKLTVDGATFLLEDIKITINHLGNS